MKLYMAPMEGPTGYVFRNAFNEVFGGIDRYFTPFVTGLNLGDKEKRDICPKNNAGMDVVTQILTRRTDEFLSVANFIHDEYGYERININLGCPSGTVVSRNRGAGFLAIPDELDRFLYEIFEKSPIKISLKTRIGVESTDEWDRLLSIYEKYPLDELIIHPRLRTDFYKNEIKTETFKKACEISKHSLCYNGDINTTEDFKRVTDEFTNIDAVMIGRGLLKNPFLIEEIRHSVDESAPLTPPDERDKKVKDFLRLLEKNYLASMPGGEKNTLAKLKELWVYLGEGRTDFKRALKEIKKARYLDEYHAAMSTVVIR
ncbi:MAG: tRNA-dihydrouridine synthase family protein [Lachnospiraceae bacterium]|nr:tRNA-dihydrouridine synthase family protein [Lachnospiraceae bacterium]